MSNRIVLNPQAFIGKGAINDIVPIIKGKGFQKALLISDKDLVKAEVVKKVTDILDENNLDYGIFDSVVQNPTVDNVKECVEAFKLCEADYIIAVGGGSPMDVAKAVGIIIKNPEFEDVLSLEGVAPTKNKAVTTIAIPTTAGTAAEVTINYVITDVENKRKFVCVDPHDIPEYAIVDPEMMMSMPKGLAAATGLDALTHAIEGYITKAAWELTDTFHLKSIELIGSNLRSAVLEKDPDAYEKMALAQYVAGMGFSNVGLGVVHGMAHPLGAVYNTPHGVANACLLPYVMEYNKDYTGEKYREIARAMGVKDVDSMEEAEYKNAAIEAVKSLSKDLDIPQTLSELGVKEEDLEFLAESAFKDVCTGGNPRDTSEEEILELYKIAFK